VIGTAGHRIWCGSWSQLGRRLNHCRDEHVEQGEPLSGRSGYAILTGKMRLWRKEMHNDVEQEA
jgi:hypothetical protein